MCEWSNVSYNVNKVQVCVYTHLHAGKCVVLSDNFFNYNNHNPHNFHYENHSV